MIPHYYIFVFRKALVKATVIFQRKVFNFRCFLVNSDWIFPSLMVSSSFFLTCIKPFQKNAMSIFFCFSFIGQCLDCTKLQFLGLLTSNFYWLSKQPWECIMLIYFGAQKMKYFTRFGFWSIVAVALKQ